MTKFSTDDLLSSKVRFSVGEPWDFVSSLGDNVLEGVVIGVSCKESSKPWVLCDVNDFVHNGVCVSSLIISSRQASVGMLESLCRDKHVSGNLLFSPSGGCILPENVPALLDQELPFLIGVAEIIDDLP